MKKKMLTHIFTKGLRLIFIAALVVALGLGVTAVSVGPKHATEAEAAYGPEPVNLVVTTGLTGGADFLFPIFSLVYIDQAATVPAGEPSPPTFVGVGDNPAAGTVAALLLNFPDTGVQDVLALMLYVGDETGGTINVVGVVSGHTYGTITITGVNMAVYTDGGLPVVAVGGIVDLRQLYERETITGETDCCNSLVALWIGLAMIPVVGGGIVLIKRRRAHQA